MTSPSHAMTAPAVDSPIALALPAAISVMKSLLFAPDEPLTDAQVMQAWEADFSLFTQATNIADSIAQDSFYVNHPPPSNDLSASPHPYSLDSLNDRSAFLTTLRTMQDTIQDAVNRRVEAMSFKPRVYRLAEKLELSKEEIRAFIFIILSCSGVEGPAADERRHSIHPRSELFTCRQFARMEGHHLLHFLSPSRKHFSQGLLEVDEEFAALYTEAKFRAPREVLKAIYGCTLTLDEAMTLGTSHLAHVLAEETGGIIDSHASIPSLAAPSIPGVSDVDVATTFKDGQNNRDRTTDDSAMLELLSELKLEDEVRQNHALSSNDACEPEEGDQTDQTDATPNGAIPDSTDNESNPDGDVLPYADDMDYLKNGFEVVQEACKVYNFQEKSSEEDRYTNTKRPVEALQREADAKFRKATTRFTRRLAKTAQAGAFLPRLELLVGKLKLAHFERMVILTLGTLSQPAHAPVSGVPRPQHSFAVYRTNFGIIVNAVLDTWFSCCCISCKQSVLFSANPSVRLCVLTRHLRTRPVLRLQNSCACIVVAISRKRLSLALSFIAMLLLFDLALSPSMCRTTCHIQTSAISVANWTTWFWIMSLAFTLNWMRSWTALAATHPWLTWTLLSCQRK